MAKKSIYMNKFLMKKTKNSSDQDHGSWYTIETYLTNLQAKTPKFGLVLETIALLF